MSLKPKKHSDEKKIREKLRQKTTRMETKYKLPPYTLIVSEGIKTEPYYLRGFVDRINRQYKDINREDRIVVVGTGKNTRGLLAYVDKKVLRGEWDRYKKIWLVYDKDDFPYDDFDNTQFSAEGRSDREIKTAWSNESIELWFLLHFQEYRSNNGREQYIKKLNQYFDYSKTREDLYEIIMEKGSLAKAIRRAKNLYLECQEHRITSPSAMVPATRMFELVIELQGYIH